MISVPVRTNRFHMVGEVYTIGYMIPQHYPRCHTGTGLVAMLTGTVLLKGQHRHRISINLSYTTDAWH